MPVAAAIDATRGFVGCHRDGCRRRHQETDGRCPGGNGLTISDAIRLLLLRVADEKRLPFEVKVQNAASRIGCCSIASRAASCSEDAREDMLARLEQRTAPFQAGSRMYQQC